MLPPWCAARMQCRRCSLHCIPVAKVTEFYAVFQAGACWGPRLAHLGGCSCCISTGTIWLICAHSEADGHRALGFKSAVLLKP